MAPAPPACPCGNRMVRVDHADGSSDWLCLSCAAGGKP